MNCSHFLKAEIYLINTSEALELQKWRFFEVLDSLKLISRKIWMTEKSWTFTEWIPIANMARYNLEGLGTLVGSQSHHFERLELFYQFPTSITRYLCIIGDSFLLCQKLNFVEKKLLFWNIEQCLLVQCTFPHTNYISRNQYFFFIFEGGCFLPIGLKTNRIESKYNCSFSCFHL